MIDTITFIEQYCLVNVKPIKLKNYQKEFIKYITKHGKKKLLQLRIL